MTDHRLAESVLVLDDDETGRFVLARVAQDMGLDVAAAETIAEAKRLCESRTFACALIDKNLAGENGLDFLRWLRTAEPDCAAIMVTGYSSVESTVEALRLGAADFVLKPFELALLRHRVAVQLERQRLLRETAAANRSLIAADRLVVLGTLSATIVHEVSSPLTALSTGISLVGEELGPGAPAGVAQSLADLRTQVGRITEVIRNVRSLSRHDADELQVVGLEGPLDAALGLASHVAKYRGRIVRELGPTPTVRGTGSLLTQVFVNLLVNAAHALPERFSHESEIRVRTWTTAEGEACAEFVDNGAGIPAELLPKLFNPFVTTKAPGVGTGLGLWVSRSVVEKLGGRIELDSAVGRGTTVRVVLPPSSRTPGAGQP